LNKTSSPKKIKANRRNAQKSTGPKTTEGKELTKYNALKHGLLAREIVIKTGEGVESQEEFDALLVNFKTQLAPEGTLEEVLAEKIAVAYWRLRRAYRYEVGLIRDELDTVSDDFYGETDWRGESENKTEEKINEEVRSEKGMVRYWRTDKRNLKRMHKEGVPLEEIYDWQENWNILAEKLSLALEGQELGDESLQPPQLRKILNDRLRMTDDLIWQGLIRASDERAEHHKGRIESLEKEKEHNELRLQVLKRLGSIPRKNELDRLLRYEAAIERQFYRALNQLERIQRLRLGDKIPAPLEINVDTNSV